MQQVVGGPSRPSAAQRGRLGPAAGYADFRGPDTIDPAKVSATALGGMSLKDGIKNGHVFVMDYRRILEVGCTEANFSSSPLAAFFTASKSFADMLPLAIQLFKGGPVYTPSDTEGNHWLCAKIFCQNCCSVVQDAVFHNLGMHWVNEAVYVAARRHFSTRHPLMQIMSPHAWGTININETTRSNLKSGGDGPLAVRNLGIDIGYKKVCAKAWQEFSWDHFDVPEDIKRRGCDELQHYSYKDDATKVYAMEMQYAKRG